MPVVFQEYMLLIENDNCCSDFSVSWSQVVHCGILQVIYFAGNVGKASDGFSMVWMSAESTKSTMPMQITSS